MYITRYKINTIKKKIKLFLNHEAIYKNTKFKKFAYHICRSKNIKIDYQRKLLNNIEFITNIIDNHWAETDGTTIYINNIKNYNAEILYNTIKHELIHGMIKRSDNSELSEYLEHKLMYLYDQKLIDS